MHRRKKISFVYVIIFICALALGFLVPSVLPIPDKWAQLTFWAVFIGASFLGVFAAASIQKRR